MCASYLQTCSNSFTVVAVDDLICYDLDPSLLHFSKCFGVSVEYINNAHVGKLRFSYL